MADPSSIFFLFTQSISTHCHSIFASQVSGSQSKQTIHLVSEDAATDLLISSFSKSPCLAFPRTSHLVSKIKLFMIRNCQFWGLAWAEKGKQTSQTHLVLPGSYMLIRYFNVHNYSAIYISNNSWVVMKSSEWACNIILSFFVQTMPQNCSYRSSIF